MSSFPGVITRALSFLLIALKSNSGIYAGSPPASLSREAVIISARRLCSVSISRVPSGI